MGLLGRVRVWCERVGGVWGAVEALCGILCGFETRGWGDGDEEEREVMI